VKPAFRWFSGVLDASGPSLGPRYVADPFFVRCRPRSDMPRIAAHITGTVSKIEKREGDPVTPGEVLVVLESMKMEMPLEADAPGTVREVLCREGQTVTEGDVLMVVG
jgi:acetyl-CoA carboxylase biotin carboxyl carrier protein